MSQCGSRIPEPSPYSPGNELLPTQVVLVSA
jgi:hypothetical protein